jgi:hypothetical protein
MYLRKWLVTDSPAPDLDREVAQKNLHDNGTNTWSIETHLTSVHETIKKPSDDHLLMAFYLLKIS